jgi:16S rRNA (guanine966-N2)-methyltransferase
MRIIAGKFKGKKLDFVSNEHTRPTADMVRQAFFTKIQFDIANSVFLDLFSGSGAIGLEALSRGAKEVYFVEKDKSNFEIIKKNLKNLYGEDFQSALTAQKQIVHLINSDFVHFLKNIKLKNKCFDFVYIDPPYKSNFYDIALNLLKEENLITNESLIICENEHITLPVFKNYELLSQKKYGYKMLSYLKLADVN